MLPKKERLSRSLFPTALKGRTFHTAHLTLRSTNTTAPASKFSFVVSKKVGKTAPSRNLLRRRGYSVIQKYKKNIKGIYSCAFFFKAGSPEISFGNLEEEITELLKKAKII